MKQIHPYLNFPGTCREALEFYKECFGGEIQSLQTFGEMPGFEESPDEVPEEAKKNIMHAEFKAEGIYFMASDGDPRGSVTMGDNVSLSIQLDDSKEQDKIFEKLSQGGRVLMPLEDTFWNSRFGLIADRYGITWMLDCPSE